MFETTDEGMACPGCGIRVAIRLVDCPSCHALLHRVELERLAALAQDADGRGDHTTAASHWRDVLRLLPASSRQYHAVISRIEAASGADAKAAKTAASSGPSAGSRWAKILGPLGAAGLLIWKLKFVAVALLTKGKLLLIGLTKASTMLSAVAFLAVYWKAWGWAYAAGVVGMIYIHEIGHVAALKSRGFPASAPMFVPGVGAFVRLHDVPMTPSEDARIGLAGPIWGLGAAVAAYAVALATGSAYWLAIANTAAILNVFNLTPVWQLDGSRGFHSLTRVQRWIIVLALICAWLAVRQGMLVLVTIAAIWRAFEKDIARDPDWGAFTRFAVLITALTTLIALTAAV